MAGRLYSGSLFWKHLEQQRVHTHITLLPARTLNLAQPRRPEAGRCPPAGEDEAPQGTVHGPGQEITRGRLPAAQSPPRFLEEPEEKLQTLGERGESPTERTQSLLLFPA